MLQAAADGLTSGAGLPPNTAITADLCFDAAAAAPHRLKLAVIAETMVTGVGRHVADTARALSRRGHTVHLLHSRARADETLLAELADGSGVKLQPFDLSRAVGWRDMRALVELSRYLRAHGPFDIIHGHSSKGGLYARLLGLLCPGECFYTPHAFITLAPSLSPLRRVVYGAAERCLGLISRGVLCVSEEERQHALELGIAARQLNVIRNGIDRTQLPATTDLRLELDLAPTSFVVGFVGRLDEQKAPQRVLAAAEHVVRHDPSVHFVMIGDGPLRSTLEREANDRGLGSAFAWLGRRPAACLVPGFDVLVMPSRYEGCSQVMLEALAVGVPVVCTPVGGVKEAVEDGVNGFVVPHDDPGVLAERVLRLAADRALHARMSAEAGRRAEPFTLDACVEQIEQIYLAALPRVSPPARPDASVTGTYDRLMPRRTAR